MELAHLIQLNQEPGENVLINADWAVKGAADTTWAVLRVQNMGRC